jgi:hypothetical protein
VKRSALKPGPPLARRTPLRRGQPPQAKAALVARSSLDRGGSKPARAASVKPVSSKRRSENATRRAVLVAAWGPNPECVGGPILAHIPGHPRCTLDATDPHEVLTRARGGSITEIANIIPLCRPCHDWVTTHPAAALEAGLMASQYRPG